MLRRKRDVETAEDDEESLAEAQAEAEAIDAAGPRVRVAVDAGPFRAPAAPPLAVAPASALFPQSTARKGAQLAMRLRAEPNLFVQPSRRPIAAASIAYTALILLPALAGVSKQAVMFVVMFAVVSVALVVLTGLRRKSRLIPRVEVSHELLTPGEEVEVVVSRGRSSSALRLTIALEAIEICRHPRGARMQRTIHEWVLHDYTGEVERWTWNGRFAVPASAVPSFRTRYFEVAWRLKVYQGDAGSYAPSRVDIYAFRVARCP